MSNEIAHKAVRNTFFNGLSMAGPLLAGICKSAIIARHLGPSRMGVYSYAIWIAGALSVVASLGLPSALTKYVSEYLGRADPTEAARLAKHLVKLQLKVVFAIAIVAGIVAFFLVHGPERLVLVLSISMVVPIVVTQVLGSVLAGWQHYQELALINVKSSVATVGLVALAVILKSGIAGILLALTAGYSVGVALSYRAVRPRLREGSAGESPTSPAAFQRAKGFALTEAYILLLDGIIWQRCEVFFLKILSTLQEVAFYGISFGLAGRLQGISESFTGTLLPLSSEAFGRSAWNDLGKIYSMSLKYVQMVMVPLCLLGIGVATPLIGLIYGPDYLPLVPVLRVLLASVTLTSLAYVGAAVLYATERQGFIARCQTPIAALNIVLDIILIRSHGAMGAAIANSSAQVLEVIFLLGYAGRVVGARFPWRATARIYGALALASLPEALAARGGAGSWTIAGLAVLAFCIYAMILIAWGEVGGRELRVLTDAIGHPIRHGVAREMASNVQ